MGFQAKAERASLELTPEGLFLNEEWARHKVGSPKGDAYHEEAAYFVKCAAGGHRPELCLPEDSARAIELAILLKKSRAKGGEAIAC